MFCGLSDSSKLSGGFAVDDAVLEIVYFHATQFPGWRFTAILGVYPKR